MITFDLHNITLFFSMLKVLENLDGSTPPVQTIIFENTNFKSGPADVSSKSKYGSQLKSHRYDKGTSMKK